MRLLHLEASAQDFAPLRVDLWRLASKASGELLLSYRVNTGSRVSSILSFFEGVPSARMPFFFDEPSGKISLFYKYYF
jgi:hypothetical protein